LDQIFVLNGIDLVPMKAPVPLEKMPEVILNSNRSNDHKVFVLMVFSK
jgi:hypothetical protein